MYSVRVCLCVMKVDSTHSHLSVIDCYGGNLDSST